MSSPSLGACQASGGGVVVAGRLRKAATMRATMKVKKKPPMKPKTPWAAGLESIRIMPSAASICASGGAFVLELSDFVFHDQIDHTGVNDGDIEHVSEGAEEGGKKGGERAGAEGAAVAERLVGGRGGAAGLDGEGEAHDSDGDARDHGDALGGFDFFDVVVVTEEVEHKSEQGARDGHAEAVVEIDFHNEG